MNIGKKEGIIIFTKDHPERLQKTLPQLFNIDLPVILLDDSVNFDTKVIVKKLVVFHHQLKFTSSRYNFNLTFYKS